jgi:hypothetical protein
MPERVEVDALFDACSSNSALKRFYKTISEVARAVGFGEYKLPNPWQVLKNAPGFRFEWD